MLMIYNMQMKSGIVWIVVMKDRQSSEFRGS